MSSVRRATVDDFYDLLGVGSNESIGMSDATIRNTVRAHLEGEAFAVVTDGGVLLALVGGREIWPGVADVWALVTKFAEEYALALHRAVKRLLRYMIELRSLRRIEVNVLKERLDFQRWAERLGFELVGDRSEFGPSGEDFLLYGWVTSWHS